MRTTYSIVLLSSVLLACTSANAQVNSWIDAGGDSLWSNPDNWSLAIVPGGAWQHPFTGWDDPSGTFYPLTPDPSDDLPLGNNNVFLDTPNATTLIDSSVEALAYGVRIGGDRGAPATLEITGGSLQVGGNPDYDPNSIVGWHLDVGRGFNDSGDPDSKQRVVMSGGTVTTNGLLIPEQFVDESLPDPTDSAPLNGELIMSGGVINARWMNLGQLKGNGMAQLSGDAVINLASNVPGDPANGGHLEFNRNWYLNGLPVPSSGNVNLDISGKAVINIYGHRNEFIVSPDQSEVNRYEGYVDAHELTAYGGTAAPIITLHTDGTTMITIEAPEVPGDANGDGVVDLLDLDILGTNFGQTPADYGDGDFNDDDVVDLLDLDILGSNFGLTAADISPLPPLAGAAVPEPAAFVLLGMGIASLVGRRRCS